MNEQDAITAIMFTCVFFKRRLKVYCSHANALYHGLFCCLFCNFGYSTFEWYIVFMSIISVMLTIKLVPLLCSVNITNTIIIVITFTNTLFPVWNSPKPISNELKFNQAKTFGPTSGTHNPSGKLFPDPFSWARNGILRFCDA